MVEFSAAQTEVESGKNEISIRKVLLGTHRVTGSAEWTMFVLMNHGIWDRVAAGFWQHDDMARRRGYDGEDGMNTELVVLWL